jgi:Family of unknown function (DUF6893)
VSVVGVIATGLAAVAVVAAAVVVARSIPDLRRYQRLQRM